jgi:hypothetical protein
MDFSAVEGMIFMPRFESGARLCLAHNRLRLKELRGGAKCQKSLHRAGTWPTLLLSSDLGR